MPDLEHSVIPLGEVHTPYNWVVSNETERLAIVPVDTPGLEDTYKLCLQLDTGESFRLDTLSPVTWTNLSPTVIDGGTF